MKMSVTGTDEIGNLLEQIAPRHARNIMRATIQAIASDVRKDVAKNAPVGEKKRLRRGVKARRLKSPPDKPVSVVYFQTGKGKNPDAFFWRFHEYGTVHMAAQPFVTPAKERHNATKERVMKEKFGKVFERALERARAKG